MGEKSFDKFLEEYEETRKKFDLPSFKEMRENFDLNKIYEIDGNILVRDVRRVIGEKITNHLHLFETLLNPSSPPMFVFNFLKNVSESDRKEIKEIYKELSKMQIKLIKLDTLYDEKNEAEFIKTSFADWQKMKKRIFNLVETFEKEFVKNSVEKEKSYFG